jgi:hypothetical protein
MHHDKAAAIDLEVKLLRQRPHPEAAMRVDFWPA